jgi:8-oxo-dGTP diphosphatase
MPAPRDPRETGLDIEPRPLIGVYKNMPAASALIFRCKMTGGQLTTTNNEVTAFHWAHETDIRHLTSEAYAVRLLDALRFRFRPR